MKRTDGGRVVSCHGWLPHVSVTGYNRFSNAVTQEHHIPLRQRNPNGLLVNSFFYEYDKPLLPVAVIWRSVNGLLYGLITAVSSVFTDSNVGFQIGRNTSHGSGVAGGEAAPEAVALGGGRLPRSGVVSEGVQGEGHAEGVAGERFEGVDERHRFADGRGHVRIFEAVPAVVLVSERRAQPRARVLGFAEWQRVAGEGSAVLRVVQHFNAGGGGHGEVAAAGSAVEEGIHHGLSGGEVFRVDGDGGLD